MKKLSLILLFTVLSCLLLTLPPVAQATVTSECTECSGWACLGSDTKDFFTTGRYGDGNPTAGAWELAIWEYVPPETVRAKDNFGWPNGVAVSFSLSYDPSDGKVTYTVDGKTLTWYYSTGKAFGVIIPFAKGKASGNNVELTELNLYTDQNRSICDIITANDYRGVRVLMSDSEQVNGFTITGKAMLTWGAIPANEIPGFHIFLMNTHEPTVITLSSFIAEPMNGSVFLFWETASEIDNVGFNLYRSESKNGGLTLLNDDIIIAEGSPTEGMSYEFIDENVQNRTTYYYMLEDIDIYGISTLHGPVSAMPRVIRGKSK